MSENLKLAIQKKGRLHDKSIQLLKSCGIDIENFQDRLFISSPNFNLDILFLRDDDIPEYVQDNVAHIGIVGENVMLEKGLNVDPVKKLGFGKCSLMLGIPEKDDLKDIKDIEGKTIATSYPKILNGFLHENTINAKVIQISGSVEIAPSLGVADYICDLVSTGNTLKLNKLKKSFKVLDSQAILIKSKKLDENVNLKNIFDKLLIRIESSLNARKSKYIMMNVPKESLEKIIEIIPSLKSPTILPLSVEGLYAVHAVIKEDKFWEINEDLKEAGASGILSLPIENIIL
ncbi:MAG: ATP phosphoribosyltransferase [Ignavibacteriae bacterium]|nr:ATP phosphoribosyltransferase [Ignavibacteriota bacterium]MCB9258251.1 ATP phosphoribosyltransferase [Ignavibacteriales bacterium]